MLLLAARSYETPTTNAGSREQASGSEHRVVFHVNSGDENAQKGALTNVRHLYQELGSERLQVELVAHGAGLMLFTKKRHEVW